MKNFGNDLYEVMPLIDVPTKYKSLAKSALDLVSMAATLISLNYVTRFQLPTIPGKEIALAEDYGLFGVLAGETFSDIFPSSDRLSKLWKYTKIATIPTVFIAGIIPFTAWSTYVYSSTNFSSLYFPIVGSDYSFLVAWFAQWAKNRIK